jgi:peptidoglycan/LPS O-acetylase OafA/YrhL/lysophospholipase L1-like esterase
MPVRHARPLATAEDLERLAARRRVPAPESRAPMRETGLAERRGRLPHLAGLDGLRAIAVAAVLFYHAGVGFMPGGFLGVEVFFVISGYLITGLLLSEWGHRASISLTTFWFRRARRLLPALFVVLLATLAFAVVVVPEEVTRVRADALAAAAYVSNWYLVFGEQSYFETAERQSPLLHLWSLAVEEQFYVVWPVVLTLGLALLRRRTVLVLTLAVAAASALWMAILFDPSTDPSRVYYGTDTRLTGLLLGSALAFVWVPSAGEDRIAGRFRFSPGAADGFALLGAGVVAWFFLTVEGGDPFLYTGGLAVVALATAALIAGAVHPGGRVGRLVLEQQPLRWIGTRSYAIYLWHWPIFSVTRPGLDVPLDGLPLLVLRLVLTGLLAEVSFRVVEAPIRRGVLGRAWRDGWAGGREGSPGAPGTRSRQAAAMTALAAVAISGLLVTVAAASPPERPSYLPADSVQGVLVGNATASPRPSSKAATASPTRIEPSARPSRAPEGSAKARATERPAGPRAVPGTTAKPRPTPPPTPVPPVDVNVLAVGDSILVDVAPALADALGRVEVDAAIGRQVDDGVAVLESRRAAGRLPEVVIVNLGVNGPLFKAQFDRAMAALANVDTVIWVNVTVPRDWEDHTNEVLAQNVPRYPNARLVDWHAVSAGRPDLFWKDGYHPRPEGATLYANLVANALR